MTPDNKNKPTKLNEGANERMENSDPNSKKNITAAHDQAEEDIQQDAEFSSHSPNDDLDEGETARLGEDKTDLV
jgi:hypothetical protein